MNIYLGFVEHNFFMAPYGKKNVVILVNLVYQWLEWKFELWEIKTYL